MDATTATCVLCGDPMPRGEEMFKYHGYSGPCPKPPLTGAQPSLAAEPDSIELGRAEKGAPILDVIRQFPHCDALVLHAPGECRYCDAHPDWQQLRQMWGLNFTGKTQPTKAPCPAERRRPASLIHRWFGNRPQR
jgi:hypothetical protein